MIHTPYSVLSGPSRELPRDTYAESGRTIIHPLSSGGAASVSRVIPFSHWIECDQATPGVVQPLDPGTGLQLYSNAEDNYDSTTNGRKGVIKIAPRSLKSSLYYAKLFAKITLSGTANYTNITSNSSMDVEVFIRARAITADFDITTLTWNGLAALTIGNTMYEDHIYGGGDWNTSTSVVDVDANAIAPSGGMAAVDLFMVDDTLVHGIIFDVKTLSDTAYGVVTSRSATGGVGNLIAAAPYNGGIYVAA